MSAPVAQPSGREPAAPSDGLPAAQRRPAIVAVALAILLAVIDGTIVNLALPGIAADLSASPAEAVWVVNAYQIAILGMLLPLAALGDRYGHRRVYLGGIALFTVASLGCALAGSIGALAAARAVQGLGAAGIMAVNAALIRLIYPRALLGRGISINAMVVGTGSVAGPTLAALVLSHATWPWLFALNLPLGALALAMGWRALPRTEPRAAGGRLSLLDMVLNFAMFALVFVAADLLGARGAEHGGAAAGGVSQALWGAIALIAGLGVSVVYLRRQWRQPAPLLPIDLLRIPLFGWSIAASVAAFSAQMLAFIALPFMLLEQMGRSHAQAGLLITAWPAALIAVAPLAGRLVGRVPAGTLGAVGMAMLAAGLALLASLPLAAGDADVAWRMALCGVGFGLFQTPNNHTIITTAPPHRSGGAGGMLGTARLTGQTLGAVTLAAIFSAAAASGSAGEAGHIAGTRLALGLAAALGLLAAGFSAMRLRGSARAPGH